MGSGSAVVEFLDGEMNVLRNAGPWQVATNFLITPNPPDGVHSECGRYNTAYTALEQAGGRLSPEEAMGLLNEVSQINTLWSVTYDLTDGDVRVVTDRQYDAIQPFILKQRH
jgi:hypothetical protein